MRNLAAAARATCRVPRATHAPGEVLEPQHQVAGVGHGAGAVGVAAGAGAGAALRWLCVWGGGGAGCVCVRARVCVCVCVCVCVGGACWLLGAGRVGGRTAGAEDAGV